jgi:hypothetical protein
MEGGKSDSGEAYSGFGINLSGDSEKISIGGKLISLLVLFFFIFN